MGQFSATFNTADSTATIALVVDDVDEAIRWALGFGEEAWIVEPPGAVQRARETIAQIAGRYERH